MNWIVSKSTITETILDIENSYVVKTEAYNRIIAYCEKVIDEYSEIILTDGFENDNQEIQFFKIHKPDILSQILMYKKLIHFEIKIIQLSGKVLEDEFYKISKREKSFLNSHHAFRIYIELNHTHGDEIYFLRKSKQDFEYNDFYFQYHEPKLSTGYDILLSSIKASGEFLSRIPSLIEPSQVMNISTNSKVKWTNSKAALTELILALHHGNTLNNGALTLKQTIDSFEQFFKIDLGEYHHTAIRLRDRNNPTKYLDELKMNYLNWMQEIDN